MHWPGAGSNTRRIKNSITLIRHGTKYCICLSSNSWFLLIHRLYGLPRRHSDLLSLRNGLLDLLDLSVDSMVDSLLGNHESESVEIGHALLGLTGSNLLGPGGLLESLDNAGLLEGLLHQLGVSGASNIDLEISQGQPANGQLLSLNAYGKQMMKKG